MRRTFAFTGWCYDFYCRLDLRFAWMVWDLLIWLRTWVIFLEKHSKWTDIFELCFKKIDQT